MDLAGLKFNRLTVVKRRGSNRHKIALWLCRCICGTEKVLEGYRVKNGIIKSCGCMQREAAAQNGRSSAASYLGSRFGRLLVIQRIGTTGRGNATWLCLCQCGNTALANGHNLTRQSTRSCGCIRSEAALAKAARNVTHGQSKTKAYRNFIGNQRKARKINATPAWADNDAIKEMYRNCPKGYHVDHEIPLLGKLVSGLNVETNLQYLPKAENEAKSNYFTPIFTKAFANAIAE